MKKSLVAVAFAFTTIGVIIAGGTKDVCAATKVATIGKKSYSSLPKAISKVKNKQTIKLRKSVKLRSNLTVSKKGKRFTIDLNKKKLSMSGSKKITVSKGTMIIKNKGRVDAIYSHSPMIYVKSGATL